MTTDSGTDARKDAPADAGKDQGNVQPDATSDADASPQVPDAGAVSPDADDGAASPDGDAATVSPDAEAGTGSPDADGGMAASDADAGHVAADAEAGTASPDADAGTGSVDADASLTNPDADASSTPANEAGPDAPLDQGADVAPVTLSSIDVTPGNASIPTLTTLQYTATGHYSDGSTQDLTASVDWTSSSTDIATITSPGGLATATSNTGTTSISATLGTVSGSTNLTASPASLVSIAVTPADTTIAPNTTQPFTATGTYNNGSTQDLTAQATWASSNTSVATIDSSTGLATGLVTGQTNITATIGTIFGQTTLHVQAVNIISIDVTPASPSVPKGINPQFKAVATFDDASTQDITLTATWDSDTPATATISSTGLATTLNPGTTIISATQGGRTGLATLEVTTAALTDIIVTPGDDSIPKGTKRQFTATGIYTDNSQQNLTVAAAWVSTDTSVATIANGPEDGIATALAIGTTAISATYQGVTGAAVLRVTDAVLKQIQVTPPSASIAKGTDQPFTATGIYTDNTSLDITNAVSWSSDAPSTATISPAGVAHGLAVGTSIITATQGGITSNAVTLTVTNETLVSIAISATTTSIPDGLTVQFTAIGTFTDNSTQDLTATATWNSSDTTIANIDTNGMATADSPGTTNITATKDGKTSNTIVLTVTDAVLQSITVAPPTASKPKGLTQQFTATGHYSNATTLDLTTQVTWTSGTTTVATVNPSTGLAKAVSQGSSVIKAAMGSVNGTATLTVTDAILSTITVVPDNACIASASSQQFIATGHFSDGSTVTLTGVATWLSSDTSVATISNVHPNEGLATAQTVASGTQHTTISATYNPGTGAVSGSATLGVGACARP